MISDEDFKEMISDFEGFMHRRGYLRTEEVAKKEYTSPQNVRIRYWNGKYKNACKIGQIIYIHKSEL